LVVAILSAVATAAVARVLGVAVFGQYAAAMGTVTLLLALCDLGFSLVLGRELAMSENHKGQLLRTAVRAETIWSAVVAVVVLGIAFGLGVRTTRGEILLIMIPVVVLSGYSAYRQIFLVMFDVGFLAKVDIASNVLTNGAMIGVALLAHSAVAIAVAYSTGTVGAILVVASVGNRRLERRQAQPMADVWSLARRAFPFGVNSIIASAYFTIDLVLIQFLVSPRPLGNYAAACKFLSIVVTVPGLILSAALPALAMLAQNRADSSALTARLTHWLAVTALPLNVGLCIFARTAVHIAFGASYSEAVPLVRILAGAGAVGCLLNPLGMATVSLALNRQQMFANAIALGFNVSANLVLVPIAGVIASAWLTLATDALAGGITVFILRERMLLRPVVAVLGRPLAASAALAGVGVALASSPALAMIVSAAVYIVTLTVMRGWPIEFSARAASQWRKWRSRQVGAVG
jgi:O-antigen/teichoic acid export membrane protein